MSRMTLDVHDEWQTDAEKDVDLTSDLTVDLSTQRTPIAWVGLVLLLIGTLLVAIGGFVFAALYPDAWYAIDRTIEQSQAHIRRVMTLLGLGCIGVFLGASMYFFGRSTRGRGDVEGIRMGETL